jgi:hypothetical protein
MTQKSTLLALLSVCLAGPCAAQEKERPASDARSFQELFRKLENDWIQATQRKDQAALDSILAPEFTVSSSESPENPLSRADWIQRALTGYDIRSYEQRSMVIRAFVGVAVVSFVQSQKATLDGKDRSGDYMIVDLWEASHNKWQVSARYQAPVVDHSGRHVEEHK